MSLFVCLCMPGAHPLQYGEGFHKLSNTDYEPTLSFWDVSIKSPISKITEPNLTMV